MSTDFTAVFVEASLRAAAVLAAGWALAACLRRASAATRHFTWVCTIVAAALVPLTTAIAPDWTVRPPSQIGSLTPAFTAGSTAAGEASLSAATLTAVAPQRSPARDRTVSGVGAARIDWTTVLAAVWTAGTAAVLLYMLLGAAAVHALRRSTRPVPSEWLEEARALGEAFDLPASVVFLESGSIRTPIVCGAWRPVIVVPATARDWPRERLRVVLLHELAHVRRRDCLTQTIARMVCAIYWFNPLTWIAARRLRAERERACDDFVLAAGTKGSDYAGHLLDIARAPAAGFSILASASVPMAHRSQLEGRLMAILDPAVRRSPALYSRAAALAATALISIPVAALQPQEPAAAGRDIVSTSPAAAGETAAGSPEGTVVQDTTGSASRARDVQAEARKLRAAADALRAAAAAQQKEAGEPARDPAQTFFVGDRRVQLERSRTARALDRALLEAAQDGDVQGINDLIAAGADVNAPVDGDGSALIVAARRGRLDIVRLLLDRGADPNLGVEGDGSAIIMAAREGHIGVVELLLERGAHIDQVVDGDENALIQASGSGRLEMVKLLVSRGADVNTRVLVRRSTVTQTETEVFDNLGQRRVLPVRRLQTRDEWRSPLSMARQGGHDAVVAFLISLGAQE